MSSAERRSAEDVLNVLWLARLGGVRVEGDRRESTIPACSRFRCSNRSKICRTLRRSCRALWSSEAYQPLLKSWGTAGDHARLLRLEQRRRHDHQHVGDLEGAPRAASRRARVRRDAAALPRPRRNGRPRRRTDASRHLRAAGRQLLRRAAADRAGRGAELEVLRRGAGRAQS